MDERRGPSLELATRYLRGGGEDTHILSLILTYENTHTHLLYIHTNTHTRTHLLYIHTNTHTPSMYMHILGAVPVLLDNPELRPFVLSNVRLTGTELGAGASNLFYLCCQSCARARELRLHACAKSVGWSWYYAHVRGSLPGTR